MTGNDFLSLGVTSIHCAYGSYNNIIKFKVHRMECIFFLCLIVKFLILFFIYIHYNLKLPYFIIIIIIWDYFLYDVKAKM